VWIEGESAVDGNPNMPGSQRTFRQPAAVRLIAHVQDCDGNNVARAVSRLISLLLLFAAAVVAAAAAAVAAPTALPLPKQQLCRLTPAASLAVGSTAAAIDKQSSSGNVRSHCIMHLCSSRAAEATMSQRCHSPACRNWSSPPRGAQATAATATERSLMPMAGPCCPALWRTEVRRPTHRIMHGTGLAIHVLLALLLGSARHADSMP